MTDAFPAEEYGTGSRRTPLVDAPTWLKEASRGGDRATLAPAERAFLDSPPSYEEPPVVPSLAPPPVRVPSLTRRIMSMLLFVMITSGACAVLGLAVMRMLGKLALP